MKPSTAELLQKSLDNVIDQYFFFTYDILITGVIVLLLM